jgi:replicative DNA helicase
MADLARPLPHDLEAERAVLGALLMYPERYDAILPPLVAGDFYREVHRYIYRAIEQTRQQYGTTDAVLVRAVLAERQQLDEVGADYLAKLFDGVPNSLNVAHYASIVRERALRRALIHLTVQEQGALYDGDEPPTMILDRAQELRTSLSTAASVSRFIDLRAMTSDGIALLDQLHKDRRAITGLATGFSDLDVLTCGLQPGELVILAARPSMGKSSFAANVALQVGRRGQAVAVFALEMSRQELWLRLLACEGDLEFQALRRGYFNSLDLLTAAVSRLSDVPMFIDDAGDQTVPGMRAKTRALQSTTEVSLVIVDYLQLVRPVERGENRNLELAAMTRGLKLMSKDLRLPVFVMSQLSRECERRSDKRPLLSDLRDSGAIEQDADVVLFLYREEVYTKERPGEAELIVAKNRNGPIGTVDLVWRAAQTKFLSRTRPSEERRWDDRDGV